MSSLLDQVRAKQKELDSKRSKDFSITPPAGNSRWRILPHWSGDLENLPVHDFGQHFIKDPHSKEVKAVVVCNAKTFADQCEVCDQIASLKADAMGAGNEEMVQYYNEARSAQKHLVNAVRWEKDKGYHDEVVTLALPMTAFEQLMGLVATYYAEGVNLFDMEGGHDIIIMRNGSGRNTKYTVMAAPTASVIDSKYQEKAQNLEEYVNQINEEKTRAALAALGVRPSATAALPAAVTGAASPALTASPTPAEVSAATVAVEKAEAETVAEGPESVADALGDVDLDDLDLGDLSDADLSDVI
jgi:hypothetical protein